MRILLLGANGQVGTELQHSLCHIGHVVAATRTGRLAGGSACEAVDLARVEALGSAVSRIAPDIVVNAAAYTAVDRAESEPELAHLINAEAPGVLADACHRRGIPLVHYSTDYVFDGNGRRPYREDDSTSPQNVYGASKLAGEQAIAASGVEHLILRTAWVYGLHGHNFLRTMLRLGAERDVLDVVNDQRGCPTPSWLIADATAQAIRCGISGMRIRHLVTTGNTTWYGFADAIFAQAAVNGVLDRRPLVSPVPSAAFPTPVRRPEYSVMTSELLQRESGLNFPGWHEALRLTFSRGMSRQASVDDP